MPAGKRYGYLSSITVHRNVPSLWVSKKERQVIKNSFFGSSGIISVHSDLSEFCAI